MMDFFTTNSRDAFQYVKYSKSYYNFVLKEEAENGFEELSKNSRQLLEHLSKYVNDGVRGFDSYLLLRLIKNGELSETNLISDYHAISGIALSKSELMSSINAVNLLFHQERQSNRFEPVGKTFGYEIVTYSGNKISIGKTFQHALSERIFCDFLLDACEYSLKTFLKKLQGNDIVGGFIRYEKYTRIDVIRLLGWETHPVPLQNVGDIK